MVNKSIMMGLVVLILAGPSAGIIDPNFTPKHLTEQADVVFAGKLTATDNDLKWKVTAAKALKGKAPAGHALSLSDCEKDHVQGIVASFRRHAGEPAIIYSGTLQDQKRAYMHMAGMWLSVKQVGAGRWSILGNAPEMSGT